MIHLNRFRCIVTILSSFSNTLVTKFHYIYATKQKDIGVTKVIITTYDDYRVLEMAKERLMLEAFLVKGFNASVRDEEGRNALYWAIYYRHRHNVKILLQYHSSLMVTEEIHALFHAIASSDIDIFIYIFTLEDMDVNMRDKDGVTLMMRAIEKKSIQIVRYLMNRGADLYLKDNQGRTVSDYIKLCDYPDLYNLVHYRMVYDALEVS